jgi:hypothetical protein
MSAYSYSKNDFVDSNIAEVSRILYKTRKDDPENKEKIERYQQELDSWYKRKFCPDCKSSSTEAQIQHDPEADISTSGNISINKLPASD